jgi:anti-anti-sigma factor
MAPEFRLSLTQPCYTYQAVVQLSGRLVLGHGANRDAWAPLLEGAGRIDVLLDLNGVTQLDAAGIGVLVDVCRAVHLRGGTVGVFSASARIRHLLHLTRVCLLFDRPTPCAEVNATRPARRSARPTIISGCTSAFQGPPGMMRSGAL